MEPFECEAHVPPIFATSIARRVTSTAAFERGASSVVFCALHRVMFTKIQANSGHTRLAENLLVFREHANSAAIEPCN